MAIRRKIPILFVYLYKVESYNSYSNIDFIFCVIFVYYFYNSLQN